MTDYFGSKGAKLYGMTAEERLTYNSRTGQSNLIEWNKKLCLFMEAVFGAKASPIFRERMLPRCMLSEKYIPSPGLPDEDDQSAVVSQRKLENLTIPSGDKREKSSLLADHKWCQLI